MLVRSKVLSHLIEFSVLEGGGYSRWAEKCTKRRRLGFKLGRGCWSVLVEKFQFS